MRTLKAKSNEKEQVIKIEKITKNGVTRISDKSYKRMLKGIKWASASNGNISMAYLAGINRPVKPHQVTTLSVSLERKGSLRPVVTANISFLTGKTVRYIIDGQHLFNSHIRLGWDVPYITVDIKDKKDLVETIALLNSSSKSWTMLDYVTAWSSLHEDYVKLNHYYEVYDIEIGILAAILSNHTFSSGSGITKKIKHGTFKIINEKNNVKLLDYMTDMLKVVPRMNRFENKYACSEYIKYIKSEKTYNDAKHKTFIKNISKPTNKKKFILATQQEGKLSELFRKLA